MVWEYAVGKIYEEGEGKN